MLDVMLWELGVRWFVEGGKCSALIIRCQVLSDRCQVSGVRC